MKVIETSALKPDAVGMLVHGSTVVINAITERRGAPTAVITTKGFRDVLDLGRSNRPDLYNLRYQKPIPFVPRYLRFEVRERTDWRGREIEPLNADDVRAAVEEALASGARAIAVCFLHAYAAPDHEIGCRDIIRSIDNGIAVTLSHETSGEWREYERTSTAVLNAFVQPVVGAYLRELNDQLSHQRVTGSRYIMRSNGGMMTFGRARDLPVSMLESGPVGGVIGAAAVAQAIGVEDVISFDVGGTTAKSSLIERGEVKSTTTYRVEESPTCPGYPVLTSVVDIAEIGAGGGSIAWLDGAGKLRVGPQSAGAVPGPACYEAGGSEPTVTDAHLYAGRIDPSGGVRQLSTASAEAAIGRIGREVGLTVGECARGVLRLATAAMANAIQLVSIRRGYDPRDFSIVAFGGGGPLNARAVAVEMAIPTVVVPRHPAQFSAWGMLCADIREDTSLTHVTRLDSTDAQTVNEIWGRLHIRASDRAASSNGTTRPIFLRACEMRYKGQEHTVRVPVGGEPDDLEDLEARFHELHHKRYTFRLGAAVEIVTFHLATVFPVVKPDPMRPPDPAVRDVDRARRQPRTIDFAEVGRFRTEVFRRNLLPPGVSLEGPLIIDEPSTSTVVYPGDTVMVDDLGNLILTVGTEL